MIVYISTKTGLTLKTGPNSDPASDLFITISRHALVKSVIVESLWGSQESWLNSNFHFAMSKVNLEQKRDSGDNSAEKHRAQ